MIYPDSSIYIFVHLLKVRNGADNVSILFMKAEFKRQRMIEVLEPVSTNNGGANRGGYTRLSQRSQQNQSSSTDIDVDDI